MKYEAIKVNSSKFSVRKMCKTLELKEANYYKWKCQQEKRCCNKIDELKLMKTVENVFSDSRKTYGYRKMRHALEKEEIYLSEYKIRKIMRENGLYPETMRKYKPYRNGKVQGQFSQNILNRNFRTNSKNKIWVGDITYIKTNLGWTYLAVVIDLYNREVIGYSMSKKIDTELVKRALSNALAGKGNVDGLIFHSDRGCQYSSIGYRKMLEGYGIISSMSRPGCPYDNSCVESFFATAKKECIYRKTYATMEEVKKDIFDYIELFYNRKRMHSVLGYMSPVEYRLKYSA
jgi:transposase InsO family protein